MFANQNPVNGAGAGAAPVNLHGILPEIPPPFTSGSTTLEPLPIQGNVVYGRTTRGGTGSYVAYIYIGGIFRREVSNSTNGLTATAAAILTTPAANL